MVANVLQLNVSIHVCTWARLQLIGDSEVFQRKALQEECWERLVDLTMRLLQYCYVSFLCNYLYRCRFGGTILQFSSIQNVRPYLDTLRSTAKKRSCRQTGLESTFGPFLESWPSGRENVINVEMFPKNKASCGMTYGVTEMLKKTVAIVFFATFLNFLCEIYPFFSECSESLTWPVGGSDISGWNEKVLLHHLSRSSNSGRWKAENEDGNKVDHPV